MIDGLTYKVVVGPVDGLQRRVRRVRRRGVQRAHARAGPRRAARRGVHARRQGHQRAQRRAAADHHQLAEHACATLIKIYVF